MGCFNIFAAASQSRDEQLKRMTEAPIGPLIISLAIPTILSMLTTALYNTADTYFVSQLGTSASGAVGIVFCLMSIFQATGFTLGMGAGSVISRRLGGGDAASASAYGSASFFSALTLGTCICVLGQIFIDPLMVLLGSTPTILPYARAYARWILLGAPVMCCCFVMNNILRAEGHSAFAMCGLVTGGLLNIVLDPIFIFTFGLGISGAAAATLLSQCVSFSILFSFFLRGKSMVGIGVRNLSRRVSTYFEILRLGCPSLSRQGLASISTAALTRARELRRRCGGRNVNRRQDFPFHTISDDRTRAGLHSGSRIQLRLAPLRARARCFLVHGKDRHGADDVAYYPRLDFCAGDYSALPRRRR